MIGYKCLRTEKGSLRSVNGWAAQPVFNLEYRIGEITTPVPFMAELGYLLFFFSTFSDAALYDSNSEIWEVETGETVVAPLIKYCGFGTGELDETIKNYIKMNRHGRIEEWPSGTLLTDSICLIKRVR